MARFADRLGEEGAGRGIVHAHTVYPDGAAAAILAERLGWPLVITEHSSFVERIVATPGQREAYVAAVERSAKVFAVSEMLAGELRVAFPTVAERFHVLPNLVPVDLFQPAPVEGRRSRRAAVRRQPQDDERDREPAASRCRRARRSTRDHAPAARSVAGRRDRGTLA